MVEAARKNNCVEAVMTQAGDGSLDSLIAYIAVLWSRKDRKTLVSSDDQMIDQDALTARRVAEYARNRVILGDSVVKYYRDMMSLKLLELGNRKAGGGDCPVNSITPQLR